MFLIILHHLNQHGIWFAPNSPKTINFFLSKCTLGWTGQLGNWLFILTSGYFLSKSKFTLKKAFKIWFCVLSISVIIGTVLFVSKVKLIGFSNTNYGPLGFFVAANQMTVKDLIRSFLPTLFANNWFASAYIVFFFFVPFLNCTLEKLDEKNKKI